MMMMMLIIKSVVFSLSNLVQLLVMVQSGRGTSSALLSVPLYYFLFFNQCGLFLLSSCSFAYNSGFS